MDLKASGEEETAHQENGTDWARSGGLRLGSRRWGYSTEYPCDSNIGCGGKERAGRRGG